MSETRRPVFALQGWYPADEASCRRALEDYRRDCPEASGSVAGIVPHAGWHFSGRLATWTFCALSRKVEPACVFVFGGHMGRADRPVCMPEGAFGTPLGPVEVDAELAAEAASRFDCLCETPERFTPDNTLELQMPILKFFWPQARAVAMQVPADADLAEAIGAWAAAAGQESGLAAVAIGSTDLTHYGASYGFVPKGTGEAAHRWAKEENDGPFIERLLAADGPAAVKHALENHSACCPGAAAAAVAFARARGASRGRLLGHVTSHEVDGRNGPSMWVGYASIVY
ncbi:MAG: AmmeMemoRadiSam system protein B [Deltaproteobacteria bacterium]|nr:AmmeMemoRadiSam system protein B [Deltaproteobacteria bacterium]